MTPRMFQDYGIFGATLEIEQPADPGAQTNFSVTVPAGERWFIIAIFAHFDADANVANRYCNINLLAPGPKQYWGALTIRQIQANQSWIFSWGPYITNATDNINFIQNLQLPVYPFVDPGGIINSNVLNFQAGDAWSEIAILHFTLLI
jgi:hypothetical protein